MENHGIGTMSMGYLVRESVCLCAELILLLQAIRLSRPVSAQSPTGENPIVWRGIMVMKAVQQVCPSCCVLNLELAN